MHRYRARALDLVTGDLALPSAWIFDRDVILQRLHVRFRFFRGTWFLDLLEGVPYMESILFQKNPDRFAVGSLLRRTILSTPGVVSISTFELAPVPATRVWSLDFVAPCDTGQDLEFHSPRLRLDLEG